MTYVFVALEGANGAGKSTIRDILETELTARSGRPVFMLGQYGWLDPNATRTILTTREFLTTRSTDELLSAHITDRRLTNREIIVPNLERGYVVGDRSIVSDGPYLEALAGIPAEEVFDLYEEAGLRLPDLVAYVKTDVRIALERISVRKQNRKAYEGEHHLGLVIAAYDRLITTGYLQSRCRVVTMTSSAPDIELLIHEVGNLDRAEHAR
jgi:dTMP kinase